MHTVYYVCLSSCHCHCSRAIFVYLFPLISVCLCKSNIFPLWFINDSHCRRECQQLKQTRLKKSFQNLNKHHHIVNLSYIFGSLIVNVAFIFGIKIFFCQNLHVLGRLLNQWSRRERKYCPLRKYVSTSFYISFAIWLILEREFGNVYKIVDSENCWIIQNTGKTPKTRSLKKI